MVATVNPASAGAAGSATPSERSSGSALADNMARLASLAAIVADESGATTEEARYAAFLDVKRMGVSGSFVGSGAEGRALLDKVAYSKIGQKVHDLQDGFNRAIHAADAPGAGDLGAVMTSLFETYSAGDQRILFDSVISPTLKGGTRRYADIESWKANISAQHQVRDYMKAAGDDPAIRTEARFTEAERLSKIQDNTTAAWTALVLKLFNTTPAFRLDLSETAQKAVGVPQPSSSDSPYEVGSITSRKI